MKNILISTTRQWNPGDEFIMMGSLNIMKELYGNIINPIIFNRNPDIRGGANFRNSTRNYKFSYKWDKSTFKGKGGLHELFRIGHYDNSWKDDMNVSNIDLAVFAGSPEWYGKRLKAMYQAIEKGDIPTIFLGLGAGDSIDFAKSDAIVDRVLTMAKVIMTRDKQTEKMLKKYGAMYMPCPALFAAPSNKIVKEVKKIGLIYATHETLKGNNVSKSMHDYIIDLYKELNKIFSVCSENTPSDERDTLIIELLYATGIRVSELVNIKVRDIDRTNKSIKVLGKGDKERIVLYNNHTSRALDIYLNDAYHIFNKKNSEYLILNHNGGKLSDRYVRMIIDKLVRKANLDIKISPHTIRHTFATDMLEEGADLMTVKELLGHESLNTTSIYTHITNEQIKKTYNMAHPRAKK